MYRGEKSWKYSAVQHKTSFFTHGTDYLIYEIDLLQTLLLSDVKLAELETETTNDSQLIELIQVLKLG